MVRRFWVAALILPWACATSQPVGERSSSVDVVTADLPRLGTESAEALLALRVNDLGAPTNLTEVDLSVDLQRVRVAVAFISVDRLVASGANETLRIRLPLSPRSFPAEVGDRIARGAGLELVARGVVKGQQAGRLVTLPFQVLRTVYPKEGEAPSEVR